MKFEIIIKSNVSLAENKVITILNNYRPNISMETIFMNTKNSKTNEPHLQRLDLRSSNKYVALRNYLLLHMEKYKETV